MATAQVVDCVLIRCALQGVKLLQNAFHPIKQTPDDPGESQDREQV